MSISKTSELELPIRINKDKPAPLDFDNYSDQVKKQQKSPTLSPKALSPRVDTQVVNNEDSDFDDGF